MIQELNALLQRELKFNATQGYVGIASLTVNEIIFNHFWLLVNEDTKIIAAKLFLVLLQEVYNRVAISK
jgi:hypothetical protein